MNTIQLYQGDYLELMQDIPDKSIDMILCDLPYGAIVCEWDSIIPFEPLWEQYNRIIKDNGAICLFEKYFQIAKNRINDVKIKKPKYIKVTF